MEEYVGELDHTQWMLFVVAEKAGTAGNSDIHTVPPFLGDDVASFLLMLSALLSVRPDHVGSSWPPWFLTPRPSLEEKLHRMQHHAYIHAVPSGKEIRLTPYSYSSPPCPCPELTHAVSKA